MARLFFRSVLYIIFSTSHVLGTDLGTEDMTENKSHRNLHAYEAHILRDVYGIELI